MDKKIIIKPLTTEKTTRMAEQNRFVLLVERDARKPEIAAAVEKKYGVHVLAVRTATTKGGSTYVRGTRRVVKELPRKKAIVTLKAGERIEQV
ncbi:MAG: 50S ribosomal protein L23 [Kiritimatiellae bacterium]|nr:50S ribosomal protein L23 [Kiritimatiellia bacterium]